MSEFFENNIHGYCSDGQKCTEGKVKHASGMKDLSMNNMCGQRSAEDQGKKELGQLMRGWIKFILSHLQIKAPQSVWGFYILQTVSE